MASMTAKQKTEAKRIITRLLNPPFGAYAEWQRSGEATAAEALDSWDDRVKQAREFMETL